MSDTGFNILNGNSVSGVPDASIIELRVYDHADGSLVQAVPLDLARGQFVVSVDTAVTASWPDEIRAEIYVDFEGQIATKSITPGEAYSFFRRASSSSGDGFNAAVSAASLTLENSNGQVFSDMAVSETYSIFIDFVNFDGSYAGGGDVQRLEIDGVSVQFVGYDGGVTNEYTITTPSYIPANIGRTLTWGAPDGSGTLIEASRTITQLAGGTAPVVGGLGQYPRMLPNAEGYAITAEAPLPINDIRVANNLGELLNHLGNNRVVIPNFSGWQTATSQIDLGYSNLWIPGQLAPGMGFGLTVGTGSNNLTNVGGANRVALQHFSLAPSSSGPDGNVDPVRTEGPPNGGGGTAAVKLLLDHMHLYWGRDQLASIWYDSTSVVIADSIIGPTEQSSDGRGPIVGSGSSNILFLRDLIAGCNQRNPLIQAALASLVNCGIIGWSAEPVTFSDNGSTKGRGNVIKCVFKNGPLSNPNGRGEVMLFNKSGAGMEVYLEGNIGVRQPNPNGDQSVMLSSALSGVAYYATLNEYTPPGAVIASSRVGDPINVSEMLAEEVEAYLYENAGPNPNRRNSKITQIINDCASGDMKRDSTGLVSQLPTLAGGPSRIDNSRPDKISAQFMSESGMSPSAVGSDIGPSGWPWQFEFAHWAANRSV